MVWVVDVPPHEEVHDAVGPARIRRRKHKRPARLEHTMDLRKRVHRVLRQVLDDLAPRHEVEAVVLVREALLFGIEADA